MKTPTRTEIFNRLSRRSVSFRTKEKQILDEVLGQGVYDKRIRPAGVNSTGEEEG